MCTVKKKHLFDFLVALREVTIIQLHLLIIKAILALIVYDCNILFLLERISLPSLSPVLVFKYLRRSG
jgi:hypothetical protein